ncbi:hypothetical protein CBS9595_003947 [Malassezia furfur]|nr:hypothetical protein CBS9595_003947 [Malassezia furfur]
MAAFHESLSLAETNRVRVSLGLKPLEADAEEGAEHDTSSQAHQDAVSAQNLAAQRDAERRQADEDAARARIAHAQNRRALARKLRGPTLGEGGDDDAEGTRAWVKAAARRARDNDAARRQREQDEEAQRAQLTYDAHDLHGLRVAHDLDELAGDERVLTLRDADVLDEGEDELVDAALERAARDREKRAQAQKPRAYTGLEEDATPGRVLAKYDDGAGGGEAPTSDTGFRLGDAADAMAQRAAARHAAQAAQDARAAQRTSLDYLKNVPVSDYEAADVAFKKGKKKKRHTTRIKVEPDDDDDVPRVPPPAPAPAAPRERTYTDNVVDDDELAASLARARRAKAKRSMQALTPEAIARNLRAQQDAEAETWREAPAAEDEALTFDETTEFVRQLAQRPAEERAPRRMPSEARAEPMAVEAEGADAAATPEAAPEAATAAAPAAPEAAGAASAHDTPAGVPTEAEWSELAADADASDDDAAPETSLAGGGVAGALRMLRSQGILEETSAEQREREKTQLRYDAWRQAQKKADQQRAAGRAAPHDQRQREKREAEEAMERFKDYTPDVKLEYHDEFGRTLTQKEAWKRLSHVFHGNAPGHKAQEKRLRRIAEEQRRERMLAGDTSTLSQAFQARSERTGQAHMVLSVGHHDHAPQEIDLLGKDREADLAKPPAPAAKSAKKKARSDAPPGGPPRGPPPGLGAGAADDAAPASGPGRGQGRALRRAPRPLLRRRPRRARRPPPRRHRRPRARSPRLRRR